MIFKRLALTVAVAVTVSLASCGAHVPKRSPSRWTTQRTTRGQTAWCFQRASGSM